MGHGLARAESGRYVEDWLPSKRHRTSLQQADTMVSYTHSKASTLKVCDDVLVKLFRRAASQQHRRYRATQSLVIYRHWCLFKDGEWADEGCSWEAVREIWKRNNKLILFHMMIFT